jgi:uncharacterized protein (TIGR02147 family)
MNPIKIDSRRINEYDDYVLFLTDHFNFMKLHNPLWSLSAWAKHMGFKNTSTLSRVLKNQREIGPKLFHVLCTYFQMNEEEIRHFKILIKKNQIKKLEMKMFCKSSKLPVCSML